MNGPQLKYLTEEKWYLFFSSTEMESYLIFDYIALPRTPTKACSTLEILHCIKSLLFLALKL